MLLITSYFSLVLGELAPKKIGMQARPDIEDLVEMQVNLQLWVKVKKDWRDSDFLMKNFGYNPKDGK